MKRKTYFIVFLLFILELLAGMTILSNTKNNIIQANHALKVGFLDVGKADCSVLQINGKTVIIDTATSDQKNNILSYLKDNNISEIDYLILTHYDKDHIGCADKIIKNYNVKNVIEPDYIISNKPYNDLASAMGNKNITPNIITDNYSFSLDNVSFTIYPSLKNDYGENASNEFSLVTSIKYNNISFLFAGDAEKDRLKELENQMELSHTVLKVPHHGEKDNYSEDFISKVHPLYAVIPTSNDEKPSKKILEYLKDNNSDTFNTYDGNITMLTDGILISASQNKAS